MSFLASTNLVAYHQSLLQDRERMGAYRRAVHEVVRPGDVVLDLGAGSGALSLFACQAGARRVYAIESGDAIELAREMSRRHGLQDRIVLVNERSYRARIDEPVDVIVTETFWNFGFGEGMLGAVLDARRRFLREEGRIVPAAFESWLAPADMPQLYAKLDRWPDEYELDMSLMRSLVMNNVHQVKVETKALMAEPARFAQMDTSEVEEADVFGEVEFAASRAGTIHGLVGWFSATLSPSVRLATAPPNPAPNWGHAFFPLDEPVRVERGDRLEASVRSTSNGDVWSWELHLAGESVSGSRFTNSTLWGFPFSVEDLHRQSPRFKPTLSQAGEIERFVLDMLDGTRELSEIEKSARERFPETFPSREVAAAYVRRMVARCA
jgi:type I protein arginine methyltransferase